MRAARSQKLEEMGTKLQATALELPLGQDRHNALREIERFRMRITALHAFDSSRAYGRAEGQGKMTWPRPAGRPWTPTDDDMLRKLLTSGMKPRLIAQNLKRSRSHPIANLPF